MRRCGHWRNSSPTQRTPTGIRFRNGYEPDSPLMDVEFCGLTKAWENNRPVYALILGKIFRTQWLSPAASKKSRQKSSVS